MSDISAYVSRLNFSNNILLSNTIIIDVTNFAICNKNQMYELYGDIRAPSISI